MTPEQARDLITQALIHVVPDAEADLAAMSPDADIREYLELDSLDFVTFVERLSAKADFRIDEEQYGELRTMETATRFLAEHAGSHPVG